MTASCLLQNLMELGLGQKWPKHNQKGHNSYLFSIPMEAGLGVFLTVLHREAMQIAFYISVGLDAFGFEPETGLCSFSHFTGHFPNGSSAHWKTFPPNGSK